MGPPCVCQERRRRDCVQTTGILNAHRPLDTEVGSLSGLKLVDYGTAFFTKPPVRAIPHYKHRP